MATSFSAALCSAAVAIRVSHTASFVRVQFVVLKKTANWTSRRRVVCINSIGEGPHLLKIAQEIERHGR
jgi:hypothetical protein